MREGKRGESDDEGEGEGPEEKHKSKNKERGRSKERKNVMVNEGKRGNKKKIATSPCYE